MKNKEVIRAIKFALISASTGIVETGLSVYRETWTTATSLKGRKSANELTEIR